MTSSRAESASSYLPEVDFGNLFEFSPLPLEQDPDSDIPKPYSSPITFFDRHLDESLVLKKVTVLPSLISTISEALDGYFSAFNSKNETFRSSRLCLRRGFYNCQGPPKNATDIAERYCLGDSIFLQAASILVVHPDKPELKTVFSMDEGNSGSSDVFHSQNYTLKYTAYTRKDMVERLGSWDLDRKTLLLSMWDNLPELAIWDMYALSGRSVMEDMSGLAALEVFPWKQCGTSGHRHFASSAYDSPPDVSKYLWEKAPVPPSDVVPAVADTAYPRRSERLKSQSSSKGIPKVSPKKKPARSLQIKKPAIPKIIVPKAEREKSRYKADAADFVQRVCSSLSHINSFNI